MSKSDLPEKVRVGYRTYEIHPVQHDIDGPAYRGRCGYDQGIIQVDLSVDREMQAQVLLHEIMHGCYKIADLSPSREEKTVARMTHILTQVFQDNPEVINWIMKNAKKR